MYEWWKCGLRGALSKSTTLRIMSEKTRKCLHMMLFTTGCTYCNQVYTFDCENNIFTARHSKVCMMKPSGPWLPLLWKDLTGVFLPTAKREPVKHTLWREFLDLMIKA